ncbi:MAG: hypothetical protein WA421_12855 [Nitrososphaeraceae archaeon]
MRGSLPNPKPIDMKLNSVTQEVTRTKLSVLGDEIAERKITLATEGSITTEYPFFIGAIIYL